MKTKLTLSVTTQVLNKAKKIAVARKTSLSEIFEKTISLMDNEQAAAINPEIKALQGVLNTGSRKVSHREYYENKAK